MENNQKFSRNKSEKINNILRSFDLLIKEKKYSEISTNKIAQTAKVSIGTLYRYFPYGKISVLQSRFDQIFDQIFDIQEFIELKKENFTDKISYLVRRYIEIHRTHLEYHRALDLAILANPELFKNRNKGLILDFTEITRKLRKSNPIYQNIPETTLTKFFLYGFNLMEAIIHRHFFISSFSECDEDLIQYLTYILITSFPNKWQNLSLQRDESVEKNDFQINE